MKTRIVFGSKNMKQNKRIQERIAPLIRKPFFFPFITAIPVVTVTRARITVSDSSMMVMPQWASELVFDLALALQVFAPVSILVFQLSKVKSR